MKVNQTDKNTVEVEFDNKKEEDYYKAKIREWSGKKRVTKKLFEEWTRYVILEFVKDNTPKRYGK